MWSGLWCVVAVHGAVSTRVRVWIIGSRDQHGAVVPHAEHGRASFHLFSTRDVCSVQHLPVFSGIYHFLINLSSGMGEWYMKVVFESFDYLWLPRFD